MPAWQKNSLWVATFFFVLALGFLLANYQDNRERSLREPEEIIKDLRKPDPSPPSSDPGRGGIFVSPTLIRGEAVVGTDLAPIMLQNRSSKVQKLQIDFVPFSRTLISGAPVLAASASEEYIKVSPRQLSLRPGEQASIEATVVARPPKGFLAGSIGAIVEDNQPASSSKKRSGVSVQVRNNLRINSLVFLRWPDAPAGIARFKEIRAERREEGIRISSLMQGERGLSEPKGFIRAIGDSGVWQTPFGGGQVLIEGSLRELPGEKSFSLPGGEYQVEVWSQGERLGSRLLRVSSDGSLPEPETSVALRLPRTEVSPGGKTSAFVQIKNSGEAPYLLDGFLALYSMTSDKPLLRRKLPKEALEPEDRFSNRFDITAPQQPGVYEVLLQTNNPLEQRVSSFVVPSKEVNSEPGLWDRVRDWVSGNPLGGLALGSFLAALLLAAVMGFVWMWQKRDHRQ